jgi:cellulose synthase/poly-beta-1,6-N-acetylglucosamine synthase-like glycosyltransferase/peptidoglycan/xylan/chitin deacetylase (PgdA/CDA1 family)
VPRVRRPRTPEQIARIRRRIRRPPGHWALLGFCLLTLLVLLGVQGIATHTTRSSSTRPAAGGGEPFAGAGTILALERSRLAARRPAGVRRVALTFDDGPDPRWTPRIARELERLGVPATFFVLGSKVVRHPDVARDLHRRGFELGNHTFSHADVATLPGWRLSLQLGLTENAVAGATGVRPRLFRPPYSATPDAVTTAEAGGLRRVAERGYVVVLSDLDTRDWSRPGADAIVRAATAASSAGGFVLMHDGGGDRSQTLAALRRIVPELRGRGFEFMTASQLAGIDRTASEPAASTWERGRGRLLLTTLGVADRVTDVLTLMLVPIALLALLRMVALFAFARRHARIVRSAGPGEPFLPPVSIVVPAFNEAAGIERAARSLDASDYPDFEVIVVDDGSEDGTGGLVEALELEHVRVLRQANAGKPAALNRGVEAARSDVIVTVDGDTVFEPDTLSELVQPFRDPDVGAVAGNTKVGNRGGLLGRWQHIEYVMGFNLDRRLYDLLRCMPTVPGAIGAFRREALADIGGVSDATLAEDTDITIGIGRAGWRVAYAEDARAWTEAPASLASLWRQRYRWSYGTMQAVWKHRAALVRPREWRIGRVAIPYLVLFQILLPLLAPLIDLFALYGMVFLDPVPVIGYWLGFNVVQLALGWYAFRLDRESPRPLWAMPLQQFVYRQLMYLVAIESVISALLGNRIRWQPMERTGEVEVRPG